MKKVSCETENCIPISSSCVIWNGGTVSAIDVCDGQSLNDVIWEIVDVVNSFASEDIANFDIDSLTAVCGKQSPVVVTTLSILNAIKDNEICLGDRIIQLSAQLVELANESTPSVNLKCFSQSDNQGNTLSITRDLLDQLFVDQLCSHQTRLDGLDGLIVSIQSEIDILNSTPTTVDELSFATCIDPGSKPTSSQVITIAEELCDLELALGNSGDISVALANTPSDLNAEFGLIAGWTLVPANFMQNYGNLLLEVESLRQRVINIEDSCCSSTCKDVELGFFVGFNEDLTGILIRFTSGAGTHIPAGFTDQGSYGTITDKNGNVQDFELEISNGSETEISIVGLDLTGTLDVDITAILSDGALNCEKCLHKTVVTTGICDFCVVCASGTTGTVTIIYDDAGGAMAFESFGPTTTTISTTTTTTVGP